ncbi:hypothetical protein [Streptomyces antimicrobicus]|uniref:Uncharacterized protein n=1 Tax=Streptomyces antimicrobicus TaxID=2883108 RepID=A0ABS8BFI4_9ACTN|nr:hypothetical protein [Streptomyces antimicrobicus]MCB5183294.1 hypothetical protein [Streptomyces antimicrobicus]
MENVPSVDVGPPDDLGLRKVHIDGKPAGKVRSCKELQRLLRRAGLPFDHAIHWLGGDSTVWPDRRWRRRAFGALVVAGCLLTTAVLVKIGFKDASSALTYFGRIAGITFLAAAVVELAAAAAAIDHWGRRQVRFSGVVVLCGAVGAFLVGLVLLLVQIDGGVYTPYLWLWIVLLIWSSWALWVLVRARAWKGLLHPRSIAVGVVVSFLLAVANLGYTLIYLPSVTSPVILSRAEFRKPTLNEAGTKMFLPVHLTTKNSGQVPVYVLGTILWVRGGPEAAPRNLIRAREFIAPPGQLLSPGEEITRDEVVVINPQRTDLETVTAQTELYAVRKDKMTISPDYERSMEYREGIEAQGKENDPQGPQDVNYFRYQADITSSSEIGNVTRGERRVTFWWVRKGQWPYLYVDVAPPGRRRAFDPADPGAARSAAQAYGVVVVRGSRAAVPFAELQERARSGHSTG